MTEWTGLLIDIIPLQVEVRLRFVDLQHLPGMLNQLHHLLEMRLDVLVDSRQFFLRDLGNPVSEYSLLKCNKWHVGFVVCGKEMAVFIESVFIPSGVKLPSCS